MTPGVAVEAAAYGKAPLGIVKRNEEEFQDWLATEEGFLETLGSYGDEPMQFELYQHAFLNCKRSLRCVEKSRQVGYSWVFACESLARSHLRDMTNSIFVSYNLSDAKEKIAYCQQIHEELPLEYQKRRVIDSKLELGFQSNGQNKRVSRIISSPSKAPRGKKGDIYLDELAHCKNDREIYKGSTALILRSGGQLTVCSSPLGRRGSFWEIARQELRKYTDFWRQNVPWWLCSLLCNDVNRAAHEAPRMSTSDRVEKFGTSKIKQQFNSLAIEDFQQEFEVYYSDETMTFFPYELIMPCTEDYELCEDFGDVHKEMSGRLTIGYDVGRKRDLSVLVIMDELKNGTKKMLMKMVLEKMPFEHQEQTLRAALITLPIARASIDNNGIGMHLAENLARDFAQVVPEDFTTHSKEVWCTDLKIDMQKRLVEIPRDRELISQIHSIKKNITEGGRVSFETEKDPSMKGHADEFWALALANKKERGEVRRSGSAKARIIG